MTSSPSGGGSGELRDKWQPCEEDWVGGAILAKAVGKSAVQPALQRSNSLFMRETAGK